MLSIILSFYLLWNFCVYMDFGVTLFLSGNYFDFVVLFVYDKFWIMLEICKFLVNLLSIVTDLCWDFFVELFTCDKLNTITSDDKYSQCLDILYLMCICVISYVAVILFIVYFFDDKELEEMDFFVALFVFGISLALVLYLTVAVVKIMGLFYFSKVASISFFKMCQVIYFSIWSVVAFLYHFTTNFYLKVINSFLFGRVRSFLIWYNFVLNGTFVYTMFFCCVIFVVTFGNWYSALFCFWTNILLFFSTSACALLIKFAIKILIDFAKTGEKSKLLLTRLLTAVVGVVGVIQSSMHVVTYKFRYVSDWHCENSKHYSLNNLSFRNTECSSLVRDISVSFSDHSKLFDLIRLVETGDMLRFLVKAAAPLVLILFLLILFLFVNTLFNNRFLSDDFRILFIILLFVHLLLFLLLFAYFYFNIFFTVNWKILSRVVIGLPITLT